jgi:hypothetical protein
MKQLLIVMASNRPLPNEELFRSLASFTARGTSIIRRMGVTDVALARNISLTLAHNVLQQGQHNMVLMLDDDMVFTDDHVIEVLKQAYESGRPTSACYVMAGGQLVAKRKDGKWLTGLGFLAIPAKVLLKLADSSETFRCPIDEARDLNVIKFTESRIVKGEWQGEDYTLCERLGGVNLARVGVGHMKQQVIMPSVPHLKEFLDEQEKS